MSNRSRTTFKKRQKELARMEKQREKFARRMQRKLEKHAAEAGNPPDTDTPGDESTTDLAPPSGGIA